MISGYIFQLLVFVQCAVQENTFAVIELFPKLFLFLALCILEGILVNDS